jgi:hypothetical protein
LSYPFVLNVCVQVASDYRGRLQSGIRDETKGHANVRLILIAAGALLTGCVDTFAQFYSNIPQYKGKNIDALVDRIGHPNSQTFIAGHIVYTWTTASTMQMGLRPMQGPPLGAPSTPALVSSSEPETMGLHFRCTLQVDTDGSGTILQLSWEGNPGSCAP